MSLQLHLNNMANNGYTVIGHVYSEAIVKDIVSIIDNTETDSDTFRRTADLYAIRQFIKAVPDVVPVVFTDELRQIITSLFGEGYFVVKSIYFDKPETSNWFVAWHQDLTISVDQKLDLPTYGPWTVKQNQFAVQPPLHILQDNFTVRIHLDDTDESNGALKVIPGSHLNGVQRADAVGIAPKEHCLFCDVPAGGMMIMRPLLMHASNRSTSAKRRRVIHIEFSRTELAEGLKWSEKMLIN